MNSGLNYQSRTIFFSNTINNPMQKNNRKQRYVHLRKSHILKVHHLICYYQKRDQLNHYAVFCICSLQVQHKGEQRRTPLYHNSPLRLPVKKHGRRFCPQGMKLYSKVNTNIRFTDEISFRFVRLPPSYLGFKYH